MIFYDIGTKELKTVEEKFTLIHTCITCTTDLIHQTLSNQNFDDQFSLHINTHKCYIIIFKCLNKIGKNFQTL